MIFIVIKLGIKKNWYQFADQVTDWTVWLTIKVDDNCVFVSLFSLNNTKTKATNDPTARHTHDPRHSEHKPDSPREFKVPVSNNYTEVEEEEKNWKETEQWALCYCVGEPSS